MLVKYSGVKGRSGKWDLGRAALLQGDIGTGKSGCMAAIHLALSGKIPALRLGDGDSQDPGRLLKMLDDGATVAVGIRGVGLTRRLEATEKKARIITTAREDGVDYEGAEAEAIAASIAGDLVFADFSRLVAVGDKARAQMLTGYLPQPSEANKRAWAILQAHEHMMAALRAGKTDPITTGQPTKEKATRARSDLAALAAANGVSGAAEAIYTMLVSHEIATTEALIEEVREEANKIEKARRDAKTAAQQASKAFADDQALAGSITELEERMNTIRAQVEYQAQLVDRATTDSRRRQACRQKLETKRLEHKNIKTTHGASKAAVEQVWTPKIVEIESRLAELKAAQPKEPTMQSIASLVAEKERLVAQMGGTKGLKVLTAIKTIAEAKDALTRLEQGKPKTAGDLQALTAELIELQKTIVELKATGRGKREQFDLVRVATCPLLSEECDRLGTKAEEIETEMKAIAAQIGAAMANEEQIKSQIKEAQTAQKEREAWESELDVAREALVAAKETERVARINEELEPIIRELDLAMQAQERFSSELSEWTDKVRRVETSLNTAKGQMETALRYVEQLPGISSDIRRAEIELDELGPEPDDAPAVPSKEELNQIEGQLKAAHAAQARLQVLARLNLDQMEKTAKLWKAAHQGVVVGRAGCIQAAAKPIMKNVDQGLERMGLPGTFVVSVTDGDFAFGLMRGTKYIDVEALSGGEKVLFAGAVLSALPNQGEGVRVLTIEGAELPSKWLAALLRGIPIEAFDATVVASCHVPSEVPKRWTVVNFEHQTVTVIQ
jgi:ribosomal protein L17